MTRPAVDSLTLVADIGGTNTRVALARGPEVLEVTVQRFRNAEHPDLASVLRAYLAGQGGVDCAAACVAIAGPVRDGKGTLTNLDWTIDEPTLAAATNAARVAVLNDLQAQGHALGYIPSERLTTVMPGVEPGPGATELVIGVGTGFNAAPVHHGPEGRFVPPAEAGHASLPVRTEAEMSLARYVEAVHGFAAVEDVLSGRGLARVYAWLAAQDGAAGAGTPEPGPDGARIVSLIGTDPRADAAMAVFVTMLGRVAGNLALDHLPFGGVYLAGGVARATAPFIDRMGFARAFCDKGRFSGFMNNFRVFVIEDDFAALTGSAAHMARMEAGAVG